MQLQDALNTIWDVRPEPKQGFISTLKKRGVSFLMVVGIGVLLSLLLIINSLVTVLDQVLTEILPFPVTWAQMLSYGVSFVIVTVLIALVYKVIPDVKIAWRDVLVGAVIAAVLFAIGLVGIGLYMRFSNPTSSYGAASSLIILLI